MTDKLKKEAALIIRSLMRDLRVSDHMVRLQDKWITSSRVLADLEAEEETDK